MIQEMMNKLNRELNIAGLSSLLRNVGYKVCSTHVGQVA
jgi:hypothetical protein